MYDFVIPEWFFFVNINNFKTISYLLKQELLKMIKPAEIYDKYDFSHRKFDNYLFQLCHQHIVRYGRIDYDKSDIIEIYDFIYHLFFMDSNPRRRLDETIRYWLNREMKQTISFIFESPSLSGEERVIV